MMRMMRIAGLVADDVIMIIAGLVADGTGQRYGDWRHVATGCNTLVLIYWSLNTAPSVPIQMFL